MFHLLVHILMCSRADYTSLVMCTPEGSYLCEYFDPDLFGWFVEADTVPVSLRHCTQRLQLFKQDDVNCLYLK